MIVISAYRESFFDSEGFWSDPRQNEDKNQNDIIADFIIVQLG